MSVKNKWRSRTAVLLPMLLCVPLLACATTKEPQGARVQYVYPPANLLVVGDDPTKPTLEQLQGPNGQTYAANYMLALELVGATRAQSLRCLQSWVNAQKAIEAGTTPETLPNYCIFTEGK